MTDNKPTEEQQRAAEAFILARLNHDDDDIPHLAQLLFEREHKLQERIDHLEGERDLVHVDIYEHLLHKAPNMGVALHIDGTAQELVGDVIAWVDKAAEALAGRDVVSLQTFRRAEEERDSAHARIDELEEENGEFALLHDLSVDEDNARIADMLECRANIHDLMSKMAVLMEGVAEGWSDGLDNKGGAAFFAVEEAQQVYTRCAARYGTPEVSPSCESGECEAVKE